MKRNNTLCKRHLTNGECVKLLGEECQYEQLTKAKEIIKELKAGLSMYSGNYQSIMLKAEQFLKETEQ